MSWMDENDRSLFWAGVAALAAQVLVAVAMVLR